MRALKPVFAIAILTLSAAAQATVHRVYPGDSIQAALDSASPGDTILVEPGVYQNPDTGEDDRYGLRVTTPNLRLIGKVRKGRGEAGKVILRYNDDGDDNNRTGQQTGIFAAPAGCEYNWNREQCEAVLGEDFANLDGFYIRGFTVEGFPQNGIQTRWVDNFEFVRNESVNNLNNGIYPTLSANGLVRNNVSYGSLDTAMWIAGSENVRVIGNELYGSTIGFEITVSNNVEVTNNTIYSNTVGVGLFHPNGAGNPPLPVMRDWIIQYNDIYDNNLPNPAPPGTFQAGLPPGYGVMLLGVSDHVVRGNAVEDNASAGVAVLDWCTATAFGDPGRDCDSRPPITDPSANNNLVTLNRLSGNGANPPPLPLPGVDLLYVQLLAPGFGNCFEKNKPEGEFTFFSLEPDGELPTDGC